jgi:hypothetical protein
MRIRFFVIASAAKQSRFTCACVRGGDCFAEFTLGLAKGETRGLAMTGDDGP